MRRRWRPLVLALVAGAVWTLARLGVPRVLGFAIDRGLSVDDVAATSRYALVLLALGVVVFASAWALNSSQETFGRRVEADLRAGLFAHLQRMDAAFFDRQPGGQLLARANTDLQQIQRLTELIPGTVIAVVSLVLTVAVMASTDAALTVAALCVFPPLLLVADRFKDRFREQAVELQRAQGALSEVVEDTVSGVRVVKGLGIEAFAIERFGDASDELFEHSVQWGRARASFKPFQTLAPALATAIVLGYGGALVIRGSMTVGELTAFVAYVGLVGRPSKRLLNVIPYLHRARVAADRVGTILSSEPRVAPPAEPIPLQVGTGTIELHDVAFTHEGAPTPLFRGLTLRIVGGSTVALVGPTASGKSTLVGLVARLYDVDAGTVALDGVDVRRLTFEDLHRTVGVVFQDPFLLADTVVANIAMGRADLPRDHVERAARLAGAGFVSTLPDGFETTLGERGFQLSGGERQRVALARAVLAAPRILLIDDATSAVDPAKEREILEALGSASSATTTLLVTSRPTALAMADRIVVLDRGSVVADGTHEELLATSGAYRRLLSTGVAR